jgi:transcriptional regulator of acetoin/glycerol metabolism
MAACSSTAGSRTNVSWATSSARTSTVRDGDVLEVGCASVSRTIIDASHLPATLGRDVEPGKGLAEQVAIDPRLDEDARLRAALVRELGEHGGNVTEVPRALGKARTQVHRWIKRFDLDTATFKR